MTGKKGVLNNKITINYSVISTAADEAQRSLRNGEISSGLKPGVTEVASILFEFHAKTRSRNRG
jgi:hypothetical protein